MEVEFAFRGRCYGGEAFTDDSHAPCFIFVLLSDKELIREFGDEITIKTDFETSLARKDDYTALVELRRALFDAVKTTEEFADAKKRKQLRSYQSI